MGNERRWPQSLHQTVGSVFVLQVGCASSSRGASSAQGGTVGGVVALGEVRRFIAEAMTTVGTPKAGAKLLADVLVEADYRGHYSHGLNRLGEGRLEGYGNGMGKISRYITPVPSDAPPGSSLLQRCTCRTCQRGAACRPRSPGCSRRAPPRPGWTEAMALDPSLVASAWS